MRNIVALSALAAATIVAAIMLTWPQGARAQFDDPICLQKESGSVDCSFQSIRQCLAAKTGSSDTCGLNPDYSDTVGYGVVAPRLENAPPPPPPPPSSMPYETR